MIEILKNWESYIVEFTTLVISVFVSFYIYIRQKSKKLIGFEKIVDYDLLSIKDELKGKILVKYNNQEATNLRVLIIKIVNYGNTPITLSDFEENIIFSFDDTVKVIDAEILEKHPKNLKNIIISNTTNFEISSGLLNPKDFIILRVILDNSNAKFDVLSRIVGVKKVEEISRNEKIPITAPSILALIIIILLTIYISYCVDSYFNLRLRGEVSVENRILSFLMALFPVLILLFVYDFYKESRSKNYS
ncbi:MAG: hypothetical protein JST02_12435 [Bacteroidetes bacterium]|nr:hypothetical protein [Bacteroidota bacterium]